MSKLPKKRKRKHKKHAAALQLPVQTRAQARQKYFPRFYRFFTERLQIRRRWPLYVVGVVSLALFIAVCVMGGQVYAHALEKQTLVQTEKKLQQEVLYWQGIVEKYPDYRDGYFILARLQYQLKNFSKAKEYLQKSLMIDPNFEQGRAFEKMLTE